MAIKVYGILGSPPVRAVLLVCKALDVEYDFKLINTLRGDHLTPEFLKVRPRCGDTPRSRVSIVQTVGRSGVEYVTWKMPCCTGRSLWTAPVLSNNYLKNEIIKISKIVP